MSTSPKPKSSLEIAIDTALIELNGRDPASDNFAKSVDQIAKLHKMKDSEKSPPRVSPDTLVVAATNLIGIILIIRHEQFNFITTKALGFIPKLR